MITDNLREQVDERVRQEQAAAPAKDNGGHQETPITSDFIHGCLDANELGDGLLFAELHRDKFVYDAASGVWLRWAKHHWEVDIAETVLCAVEEVAEAYLVEYLKIAAQIGNALREGQTQLQEKLQDYQAALFKRIKRLRTVKGRRSCVEFARTCTNGLVIRGSEIDCQPWLLACLNGTVELRTGILFPGDPRDYLVRACPVEYKGLDATAPLWERIVAEIFENNQPLIDYMQRLFGSVCTGSSSEAAIPVLHGNGRNAKTLLVETISYVLGDLAGPIPANMLLDQSHLRNSAGPTPDVMALRGLRLAIAAETDEGRRLSSARIKNLTGNDTLTGRNPHDRFQVSFAPTHTLVLLTNSKPHAPADDFALWERIHLIPFNLSFVDRQPQAENERRADKQLSQKLKIEASGILSWLVRGCLEWQQRGLDPPAIVRQATAAYRDDEDIIGDFIAESCVLKPDYEAMMSEIYPAFEKWFELNIGGKRVPSVRWLSQQLVKKNSLQKIIRAGRKGFSGLAVMS